MPSQTRAQTLSQTLRSYIALLHSPAAPIHFSALPPDAVKLVLPISLQSVLGIKEYHTLLNLPYFLQVPSSFARKHRQCATSGNATRKSPNRCLSSGNRSWTPSPSRHRIRSVIVRREHFERGPTVPLRAQSAKERSTSSWMSPM
jgi:hypothetical protein